MKYKIANLNKIIFFIFATTIFNLNSNVSWARDWENFDTTDCVNFICNHLPSYDCNESWEVQEVVGACQDNFGTGCLETAISYLHSFDYNQRRELVEIAQACKYNWGGGCIQNTCARVNPFDCNERKEIVSIAMACREYPY